MRILLLSDIHSNLEALQACLAAAPSCSATVNLGDIVGYGASPNEVTARVREMGGTFVRGNHDKVVSGLEDLKAFNPIAGLAAMWNREQLSRDHLDWLRSLPQGPIALPEVCGIQFVHGAPEDEDRYVITVQDSLQTLAAAGPCLTFFGHTHVQGLFSLNADFVEAIHPEYATVAKTETWEYRIEAGSRYMVNPGSIGQPRDGDWRAAFAMFDSEEQVVTFYRVPYDVRAAQERILAVNLPPRLATRLAAGR